jgi:predicted TIM-barrel fold metal-dependent hydrolase
MKIDAYAHICPRKFIDSFANTKRGLTWDLTCGTQMGGTALWDVNKRLEIMERYEDYVQVLVPVGEVIEPYFNPQDTAYLTSVFNDAIAEIMQKHPHKFVAGVATLPLNNIDASLNEIDRAINELGFKGINMHTPVYSCESGRSFEAGLNYDTAKPLDSPEFIPIYEKMAKYNLPIWIHPFGHGGVPIYGGEKRGKYWLHHILGWPIESAMAMSRLVCSGILTKYPNLRFIIHHCGSGIIPVLAERIDNEFERFQLSGRLKWGEHEENPFRNKRPADCFRAFYGDTALYGGVGGLECGHDFFGPEHIVFGTDFPFDMADGDKFIRKTIDSVYRMRIPDIDKALIF